MWFMLAESVWLLLLCAMDIRRRKVPAWLLAAGGILAAAAAVSQWSGAIDLCKEILPGTLLLSIAFVTKQAGYGDGIVLLCLGVLSGGGKSLLIFGIGLFLAAVFSLAVLVLRKAGRDTRIPFLPFLAAAWAVTMLS